MRRYSSPWASTAWQATVATVMGLVAKEEVVGVFGVLFGVTDEEGEDAAAGIVEDEDMTDEEKAAELSPISDAFEESSGGHGQSGCLRVHDLQPAVRSVLCGHWRNKARDEQR